MLQTRKLLAHKIEGWIICTFAASKYREMRLILILAGGLFLTTSTAQSTDSLQALNLEEITVKESRLKMPLTQTMHAITLIEGADLRKMNAQSLMQVLQYAGGLDLRQRGVHGVQGDISIRGGTFDQVLVLVDGIPLSDPQTGHHLMNIPVPLDLIERIEILKGPAARRYGPNAFSGAIQIITRNDSARQFNLGLSGGQYGTGEVSGSVSLPGQSMNQWFSASRSWSEGYRHNTDYNLSNLFYKNNFNVIRESFELLAMHSDRAFGANGFYASPDFAEQYEAIQTSIVGLQMTHATAKWVWQPRLSWRRNQDEYIFVRSNPSLYRNLHINNVWTAELNGTGAYQWGQIGVGVANQGALLHSNNLGSRRRQINSAYVDYRGAWLNQRLILNAGISVHQVTDWGLHVFPGLDAGVRLSDALRIFGTVGSTWRAPTFTDLYYEDRLNVGNPDLQPESALTYETGIYWMPQHTSLRFGYFVRDGKNLIDWTKAAADDPWRPDNFGSVTYSGWEIEYQWWPTLPWIGYLYTSYNFINGINHAPESQFSRYALDHLKNQIQFHAQFQLTKKWNATFAYRFLDRENLDDYQLVDLRTGITWSHFECYLQLDNLFDAQYTETNLVPMPGRWVMMGIKVSLDYD